MMLMTFSSIVRSRKRKLRELYALATDGDAALNTTAFDLDAPPSTQAETKFLIETDILQYVHCAYSNFYIRVLPSCMDA